MDPNAEKKKLKIFNKCYVKMQDSVKQSLKKMNVKTFKIKKLDDITLFISQVDENSSLYKNQDPVLLKNVNILKVFFDNMPMLSKANVTAVWKYIEVLYSLGKEEKTQLVNTMPSGMDMSSLEGLVNSLMTDESSGFKDIVSDISAQLESSLKGKDINQSQIVNDLMSGNLKTSGIDFEEIIRNTTKKLEKKVEDGEVDIEKLKQTSNKISEITKK